MGKKQKKGRIQSQDSAETERKIQELEMSVKETQELSKRNNAQLKQIVDTLEINVFFPNHPLRNLIAVGRNKGLSIILATQNMDSFKSKYFDFYANAQYLLIMKQQTIADSVVKDFFGVSGRDYQEIKQAIAGLQKGELIIKDNTLAELGLSNKVYKKIKVTHLI